MESSWKEMVKQPVRWLRSWFWVLINGYPARDLTVIGVTGTNGKTTTCQLIYEILTAAGKKAGLISTVGAKIGQREVDTGLHVTNPDAKVVQTFLRDMVKEKMEFAVLEVTSHRLAQLKTVGYKVDIGVLTNLTHEHLDYHGSMEKYAAAKARLFKGVKYAVLNKDDEWFEYFKNKAHQDPKTQIVEYGKSPIKNLSEALWGDYNRYNLGAAEAVAGILGIPNAIVEQVANNFKGVPGRREEVKAGQKFRVIVDFAHKPNALESILGQLRKELPRGKKLIVLFGAPARRDIGKRPMMGEAAAKLADVVIVTSDDPRDEPQDQIFGQIVAGIRDKDERLVKQTLIKENDRRAAIEMACKMARAGDIVLLAGKGHEQSLAVGNEELPWSDVEEAKKAILGLN